MLAKIHVFPPLQELEARVQNILKFYPEVNEYSDEPLRKQRLFAEFCEKSAA
jgi:hypothetical protein